MKALQWVLLTASLGALACGGPKGYVIRGEVTGFPDSTMLYLANLNTEQTIDSAPIVGGRFRLEGVLSQQPELLRIYTKGPQWVNLLIGNETVDVRADAADFPFNVMISGSQYQDQKEELNKLTRDHFRQKLALMDNYYELSADQQAGAEGSELGRQMRQIDRTVDSLRRTFIFENPDTYPALIELAYMVYKFPKDTVQMLFDQVSPELQASQYGKIVSIFLGSKILSVGDPFFDFEAEDQTGRRLRLSDLVGKDGKYVLLEFMDAGCGFCKLAAREMRQVIGDYSDSVLMVSFSMDANRDAWQELLAKDSITWTSLWSEKGGMKGEICTPYKITGRPAFFVIDPGGTIVQKWAGYGEGMFEEKIGRLKNK